MNGRLLHVLGPINQIKSSPSVWSVLHGMVDDLTTSGKWQLSAQHNVSIAGTPLHHFVEKNKELGVFCDLQLPTYILMDLFTNLCSEQSQLETHRSGFKSWTHH